MATDVKVGGKNDLFALREARRNSTDAANKVDRVIRHLNAARESGGRADLAGMVAILGTTMVDLAKVTKAHSEMWAIRQSTGLVDAADLHERVTLLEAQMAEMQQLIQLWTMPHDQGVGQ